MARFNGRRAPLDSRLAWLPPSALEAGAIRLWWLSWFGYLNRDRDREIHTHHRYLTLLQVWEECSSGAIDLTAGSFNHFAVTVVGKPMDEQGTHLTEHAFGYVARSLGRQANVQPVFLCRLARHMQAVCGGVV